MADTGLKTLEMISAEDEEDRSWAVSVDEKAFRHRIWKNASILGVVFCLAFTAFIGMVDIQSSLYIKEGMGVVCQSIVYISFVLSSLFISDLLIKKLGHKWTLTMSLCGYLVWVAANTYATWATMTIASVVVGLCAGPLWTAHGSYLSLLSANYSRRTGKSVSTSNALLFGISLGIFKPDALPKSWYLDAKSDTKSNKKLILQSVVSTGKLHKDRKQLLLIPYAVHTGLMQSLVQADFNKSFVTCSLGIWMVGLVTLPRPVANALMSCLVGPLQRVIGRIAQVFTGLLLDVTVLLTLLFWRPNPSVLYPFFLVSMAIGIGDAIMQSQIRVSISLVFPSHLTGAAFANYCIWQSVGYAVSFLCSHYLCASHKIYLFIANATLTIICNIALEILRHKNKIPMVLSTDNDEKEKDDASL